MTLSGKQEKHRYEMTEEELRQIRAEHRAMIGQFRLIDDTFFAVCFDKKPELAELILRIILDKSDLHVIDCKTQYSIKNLRGHSVTLDAFAIDSSGRRYNIEVQTTDKGAVPQRARYYGSLMDSHMSLRKGTDYDRLPENYVIFITLNDVLGGNLPIYHIERTVEEMGQRFGDGSHIVYVNASHKDDTALGKLMADFLCRNPHMMNYGALSDVSCYFKENEKGANQMCEIMQTIHQRGVDWGMQKGMEKGMEKGIQKGMEKGIQQGIQQGIRQEQAKTLRHARMMLERGLSVEEVVEYTDLPPETVHEIADSLQICPESPQPHHRKQETD